ncbi:ABC transporter ATP-binding protein [Prauserella halophila]|uniref:ABC transporter ATP-binding protein n=1 Tax=Prauserella halophila TaxID=185641 RepID=A0ABN1WEX1_9PSEU|nr:ABC transporter ATP-binding protein [Prauserella halophila]MCP2238084.1 amino acid/amide ABC transporter ATP-binding protein 1, HAAT family (TC 3.A.1.4.-) [Prauserella halophila]
MTLLEVRGLGKHFAGLHAVDDVDLDISAGEITAIIGPNGAGKSTLFNLLAGFYRPTSGTVRFKDRDVTGMSPHRTVAHGIARTFQTTNLFEDATVLENVLSGRIVRSHSTVFDAVLRSPRHRREERRNLDRAMDALEFTAIADYRDEIASRVPQEVQKRVSIALALATDPELLLLDEPAAGLTEEETGGFAQLIRSIVASGVTVGLVEHRMSMVMSLADHILVLDHGKEIASGTPETVRTDPQVIEAYLGAGHHEQEGTG